MHSVFGGIFSCCRRQGWYGLPLLLLVCATANRSTYPRLPAVYRNGRANEFLLHIEEIRGQLRNVYERQSPIFTYYDVDTPKHFPDFEESVKLVSVAEPQKICEAKHLDDGSQIYHYYSGEVGNVQFEHENEILGIFRDEVQPKDFSINIWIGEEGIHVTPHYDGVHNIFIQYFGQKTVSLSPPSSGNKAILAGKLHPYARQSRFQSLESSSPEIDAPRYCLANHSIGCDRNTPISRDRELEEIQSPIIVKLNPGDILYIPPYWLHETHSESCSVSLSVWWDPNEAPLGSELLEVPLPMEDSFDQLNYINCGIAYLAHFLNSISNFVMRKKLFINDSWDIRLQKLLFNRYYEDFSSSTVHDANQSNNPYLRDSKVIRYASQTAKFLFDHTYKRIESDLIFATSRVRGTAESLWQVLVDEGKEITRFEDDTISILFFKALDYAEEVAVFLASRTTSDNSHREQSYPMAVDVLIRVHSAISYLQNKKGGFFKHPEL